MRRASAMRLHVQATIRPPTRGVAVNILINVDVADPADVLAAEALLRRLRESQSPAVRGIEDGGRQSGEANPPSASLGAPSAEAAAVDTAAMPSAGAPPLSGDALFDRALELLYDDGTRRVGSLRFFEK